MNINKDEIEVIIEMLKEIDYLWGMKPEERELYEKLISEPAEPAH